MAVDIRLLLVLAVLAGISYVFVQDMRILGMSTRARRRKRVLGLCAAAIVMLSAIAPAFWPWRGVPALLQACTVALCIIVPLLVFFILKRKWQNDGMRHVPNRAVNTPMQPAPQVIASDKNATTGDSDTVDAMARLDELVETHVLDDTIDASAYLQEQTINADVLPADAADVIETALQPRPHVSTVPPSTTALHIIALERDVEVLRTETARQQKLILAQKAALDTERRAHARTRVLAERAVHALEKSKLREATLRKLARRERVARLKMGKAYDTLRSRVQQVAALEEIDQI